MLVNVTEYFSDGKVKGIGKKFNETKMEYWKYFDHETGKCIEEGNYLNGMRDGIWIIRYSDGSVRCKGNYIKNVRVGIWKYYKE